MGYALIRGDIYIGERDLTNGAIKVLKRFHTPMCEIEVTEERATHYNSSGAIKSKDLSITTQNDGKMAFEVDTSDENSLALALAGEVTVQSSGPTFSALAFPSGIAVGDILAVPGAHVNLSTLTIIDSAGTPATLSAGTNYTVDLKSGLVTFTNLGTFQQPLKASGQVANGAKVVSIMTKTNVERFIRVDGIDIANNNARVVAEVYRAAVSPSKVTVKTEGNDVNKYSFSADLLMDPNAPHAGAFGKYGRIVNM